MALSDREKFIMHMTTVMTLSTMGDPIDIRLLQKEMRKNRCRKLTDEEVNELWEDMKEEVLNGRAVYEEMIANFGMDHDMFKKFGHTDRDDGT
tara:strand:- start:737 stop:1015 length:279 start_codon:yes stop_codon:yes gene_type:complete